MFNVQVPLTESNEVFLMNTFSDAQLLVSPDVAGLLDRITRGEHDVRRRRTRDDRHAHRERLHRRRAASTSSEALDEYFTNLREDTDQMRVTVLTTLQCNFACDYCFQGDHGDYNKFAAKMTLETAGEVARWIEKRLDEVKPEKFTLTLVRRRAAAESSGRVLPGRALPRHVRRARHPTAHQHHHQRPAADPGGRRSAASVRAERRQDHARRRPRHPQPHAPAARRARARSTASSRTSAASPPMVPITIGGNFDETSVDSYPALLDFLKEQDFADQIVKINFKPIIKSPEPSAARRASFR